MAAKETVIETVKMTDGRLVDFPGKRKMSKESWVEPTGEIRVRFDFRNGETRTFTLRADMVPKFAAHGAEQKIGDETAGVEDLDDAILAVDELIERLNGGEWGVKREASGIAGTSILLRAIVEVTGKDVAQVREYLKTKSQAQKLALREAAMFAPVVKRLEAEKAAKKPAVDTAPLLEEIAAI
jgi:hypothetical protein